MSQYAASTPPGGLVRSEIQQFFEKFYKVTDTPNAHEQYIQMFTDDATIFMGVNKFSGRDGIHFLACYLLMIQRFVFNANVMTTLEITKFRHGMWEKVASRSHHPRKIFAFCQGSDELMAHGTVNFEFKDGRKGTADWGALCHFVKVGKELKMDFYQVYLDSAAMAQAK